MDVFERNRGLSPYLPGDLFEKNNGQEFTILHLDQKAVYGVVTDLTGVGLKKYSNISALRDDGFEPNLEYLDKEQQLYQDMRLFAPRKLEDGTWAALTRLVATTAICVDFDSDGSGFSMYESRYCFGNNRVLPHYGHASYWLAQLKNKHSLPVGNCAFRGKLGTQPIIDVDYTRNFYGMMAYLHENPFLDKLDIHGVCDMVMREILNDYLPQELKATKSLKYPANFQPRHPRAEWLFIQKND